MLSFSGKDRFIFQIHPHRSRIGVGEKLIMCYCVKQCCLAIAKYLLFVDILADLSRSLPWPIESPLWFVPGNVCLSSNCLNQIESMTVAEIFDILINVSHHGCVIFLIRFSKINKFISSVLLYSRHRLNPIFLTKIHEYNSVSVNSNLYPVYWCCVYNWLTNLSFPYRTLYCAKGNYEFGISRVIKSLEPYQKKLGTDTWYYAKRCFLSLIENMSKHMIMMRDSVVQECVSFLECCESK